MTIENILENVKALNGLKIELVGSWIWATGATFENKEKLKALGFMFSKNKKAWFYNGSSVKPKRYISKYANFEQIKMNYGSTIILDTTDKNITL